MKRIENKKDILFVLVIYGCKVEDSVSFKTLIGKNNEDVKNLFVYDNSPYRQETLLPVAKYIHDTSNSGLGTAYNIACEYAIQYGYNWLLLLDQDTSFPDGALASYRKAMALDTNMIVPRHKITNGKFVSPTPYKMKTSYLQNTAPIGFAHFSDVSPINSGILISVESFRKSGGYEKNVWLDFSDICFIEKYKKYYSTYYILPDVICTQAFSAIETDKIKIYKRYCIYLECARNFPRQSLIDNMSLMITTLRPTLSRTIKEKTLLYLKAYWRIYVLRKAKKGKSL